MQGTVRMTIAGMLSLALLGATFSSVALANDVEVVKVQMERSGDAWRVRTTLRHADSGWDHYADAWRMVNQKGDVLGTRTLHHPHENEQPFTRSLSRVFIPSDIRTVFVEAHDKVHGWSKQRVRIELDKARGERFEVRQ